MALINKFAKLHNDPAQLVNALIAMSFNSSSKKYREIYVAKKKPEGRLKGDRERKYDTKGKEKNYVYYELNTTLFDELIMWLKQF